MITVLANVLISDQYGTIHTTLVGVFENEDLAEPHIQNFRNRSRYPVEFDCLPVTLNAPAFLPARG